jgi:inorganic pyrophosphatase
MRLDRVNPWAKGSQHFRVVIETSRGSRNKYGYAPEEQLFVLKKALPEGHVFPFDFGFVPRTKGDDGDPIDVLLLMDAPTFPGCIVESRIVGCLVAHQREKGQWVRNDRFLAVADVAIMFGHIHDVRDFEPSLLEQIEHFFISYNEMAGKEFKVDKVMGAKAAQAALRRKIDASETAT